MARCRRVRAQPFGGAEDFGVPQDPALFPQCLCDACGGRLGAALGEPPPHPVQQCGVSVLGTVLVGASDARAAAVAAVLPFTAPTAPTPAVGPAPTAYAEADAVHAASVPARARLQKAEQKRASGPRATAPGGVLPSGARSSVGTSPASGSPSSRATSRSSSPGA